MNQSQETSVKKASNRILELDALRALAAINLMLFHFTHVYSAKYGFTSDLGFNFPFGKYGVELFFMLSGLVNAMTLLKKRQAGEFLASRFIRIFPSFLLVISLNLVLINFLPLSEHNTLTSGQIAANATAMPGLFGYTCLEPVTWTLQIEILFYAILLVFFASGALERPLIPLMWYMLLCAAGTSYVGSLEVESFGAAHLATATWLQDALLLRYMPLFAIGVLVQQIRSKSGDWRWNAGGILIAASVFHLIDNHDHNPAATALLIGLLFASVYQKLPVLRTKPLIYISGISYSLYLLHNNLGSVFIYYLNHAGVSPLVCFVAAIGMTIVVSSLATYWIERPLSAYLRVVWDSCKTRLRSAKLLKNLSVRQS